MSAKVYADPIKTAQAWMRWAKFNGVVRALGGGWWQAGSSRPIQGYVALAKELRRRGLIAQNPDGTFYIDWDAEARLNCVEVYRKVGP